MTKFELNKLIAEKLLGMVECSAWRPVSYREEGPALIKNCAHEDGKCYSVWTIQSLLGLLGGPPQYATTSRAGLVLLKELGSRVPFVSLTSAGNTWWTAILQDYCPAGPINLAGPCHATTPELAIALAAAQLAGYPVEFDEITD